MPRYFYKGEELIVQNMTTSVWTCRLKRHPNKSHISLAPSAIEVRPDDYDPAAINLRSDSGDLRGISTPAQLIRQQLENSVSAPSSDRVNPNTATDVELIALPGIGRTRADQIIENRPPGGYSSFEDLQERNSSMRGVNWEQLAEYLVF